MIHKLFIIAAVILPSLVVPLAEPAAPPTGVYTEGWASYYAESPTYHTLLHRLEIGDITEDDAAWAAAYIATESCEHIGSRAIITINGVELPAIVFDCARRDNGDNARSWMQENNIIFEVDYYTAVKLGIYGGGGVRATMLILDDN